MSGKEGFKQKSWRVKTWTWRVRMWSLTSLAREQLSITFRVLAIMSFVKYKSLSRDSRPLEAQVRSSATKHCRTP